MRRAEQRKKEKEKRKCCSDVGMVENRTRHGV
jgi:hypothetical protein